MAFGASAGESLKLDTWTPHIESYDSGAFVINKLSEVHDWTTNSQHPANQFVVHNIEQNSQGLWKSTLPKSFVFSLGDFDGISSFFSCI